VCHSEGGTQRVSMCLRASSVAQTKAVGGQLLDSILHTHAHTHTFAHTHIHTDTRTHFAAITTSTLLGRLSIRCWNIAAEICFHSATRALVRSGTDVGRLGLWLAVCLPIHPKGVQASQVLPNQSRQTISVWTSLCARGHCNVGTGKGLPQTVATKLEAQNRLECHCML
jgi:hypothetical protein